MRIPGHALANLRRRPPRGLVFDMDGTIIDTKAFHMDAWRELVKRHGLPTHFFEVAEKGFGKTNWQIFREWWGDEADARGWNEVSAEKEVIFRELIHGHAVALPGFHELLAWAAHHKVKIALATSGPKENAEFLLNELNVSHLFHATVFGRAGMRSKPHPEPFIRAASRLGLPTAECLGFEDSHHGFRSVIRAGMPLVAIVDSTRELKKMHRWTGLAFRDFRGVAAALKGRA